MRNTEDKPPESNTYLYANGGDGIAWSAYAMKDGRWAVRLMDTDAGQVVGPIHIFPTEAGAVRCWKRAVSRAAHYV